MMNATSPRRVVVTGLGTLNPLGNDPIETWAAICAGRSGIDVYKRQALRGEGAKGDKNAFSSLCALAS